MRWQREKGQEKVKEAQHKWIDENYGKYEVIQNRIRILKSEIDEWLCGGRNKTQEEIEKEAAEYLQRRKGGLR